MLGSIIGVIRGMLGSSRLQLIFSGDVFAASMCAAPGEITSQWWLPSGDKNDT